jgi:hypothetical protein
MFLFIFEKNIPLWHKLLLITNWFIYPFGSFLHHLVTYSNLSNPTSPKLTKLTQKLYTTFPLRSSTLHKHFKLNRTALPQPPTPFFNSFQVLWKSILEIFSPSLKNCLPFWNLFATFPRSICSLYLVPLFIYTHPYLFPKKFLCSHVSSLPCLLFFPL